MKSTSGREPLNKMEIKKIVVLGSNSFTGSHFVNYLLENTRAEVIGISRSAEYNPLLLPYKYRKKSSSRFMFFQLDINKDFEEIVSLLDRERPEVVVNYAAQGEVRNSWKWPEQWFQTNCLAVVRLANVLANRDYLKSYVTASTPEVYGTTGENIVENFNFRPSTPYATSKLAGDLFLLALHKKCNFPVTMIRSANVYGIHQQLYRIIPRTIIYLKLGKIIQLHGGGRAVRSFIHIRDVADATWKAINQGEWGEAYHLAPDNEDICIKDLVKLICKMVGKDFESSVEMISENFGQDTKYSLDCSKAKEKLGWRTTISLKEGIQEMITWIEENWEEIKELPLDYIHKI